MRIFNEIVNFSNNTTTINITERVKINQKLIIGIMVAFGIFTISTVVVPNAAYADDNSSNAKVNNDSIFFALEMNKETGEVLNVFKVDPKKLTLADKHENGIPGQHGPHHGKPSRVPVDVELGIIPDEDAPGPRNVCPANKTHNMCWC